MIQKTLIKVFIFYFYYQGGQDPGYRRSAQLFVHPPSDAVFHMPSKPGSLQNLEILCNVLSCLSTLSQATSKGPLTLEAQRRTEVQIMSKLGNYKTLNLHLGFKQAIRPTDSRIFGILWTVGLLKKNMLQNSIYKFQNCMWMRLQQPHDRGIKENAVQRAGVGVDSPRDRGESHPLQYVYMIYTYRGESSRCCNEPNLTKPYTHHTIRLIQPSQILLSNLTL